MNTTVIELIGALIAGGGITAVTTYWVNSRREDRSDFEVIVTALKADNVRLRVENIELRSRIDVLEAQVDKLEKQIER